MSSLLAFTTLRCALMNSQIGGKPGIFGGEGRFFSAISCSSTSLYVGHRIASSQATSGVCTPNRDFTQVEILLNIALLCMQDLGRAKSGSPPGGKEGSLPRRSLKVRSASSFSVSRAVLATCNVRMDARRRVRSSDQEDCSSSTRPCTLQRYQHTAVNSPDTRLTYVSRYSSSSYAYCVVFNGIMVASVILRAIKPKCFATAT